MTLRYIKDKNFHRYAVRKERERERDTYREREREKKRHKKMAEKEDLVYYHL